MQRIVFYNTLLIAGLLFITCTRTLTPVQVEHQNLSVQDGLALIDTQLVKTYQPFKVQLDKDMSRVISISDVEMIKDRPESLLTNLLADIILEKGKAYCKENKLDFLPDFAFMNYGGIRTFLPKGKITVGKIFELMPFENEMVFLKLNGSDTKSFLNVLASKDGEAVGGIRFKIKNKLAEDITIGSDKFDPTKTYWLVTNDYIAGGGDDMEVLLGREKLISSGKLIREVLIEFMEEKYEKGIHLNPELDGRVSYE